MSAGELVTRFGLGSPTTQGFGFVPNATAYWDMSTTPWTLYGFITGQGWNQIGAGSSAGDVTGPAGAVANNFPQFNGTTGKLLKDSGTAPSTDGTFSANSDALIPTQKATKTYVDAVAAGLDVRNSVVVSTAAALPTNTYSNGASGVGATLTATGNGALTVDGVAVAVGNRVLVKNEAAPANNGIYTVTAAGDGSNPYVLTRALDFNSATNIISGAFTFTESGTVNAGAGFVLVQSSPITVGTTALPWTQFSAAGTLSAGVGLDITAGTINQSFFFEPQGRLTLTSATPVLSGNVTGATTVYYTPYVGGFVPLWNGTRTTMNRFSELSQATTDTTKSPAACAANSNYDVFVWNDSGTLRATRGPAWSSDTTRGTGAGTAQISRNSDGYYTNTVAITNGPGAGAGTYVGTIRTDASSQVNMNMVPTGAAGGSNNVLGVWNAYNRVPVKALCRDTNTWTYNSSTFRPADGGSSNIQMRVSFVDGLALSAIDGQYTVSGTGSATVWWVGMNLDSTTNVPQVSPQNNAGTTATEITSACNDAWMPQLGFHFIQAMEASVGTTTFQGDRTGPTAHGNGLFVTLDM